MYILYKYIIGYGQPQYLPYLRSVVKSRSNLIRHVGMVCFCGHSVTFDTIAESHNRKINEIFPIGTVSTKAW